MKKMMFDIWLVNGNITIFCGSHTDAFKNDILASSLLGELVAAQKTSRREVYWLTYIDTVQKIGWIVNSRANQQLGFENSSLLNLVEQSTANALPEAERQAVTDAFAQLTRLQPDSPALRAIVEKLQSHATLSNTDTDTTLSTAAMLTIIRNDKTVLSLQVAFKTEQKLSIDILEQPTLSAIDAPQTNCWLLRSSLDERQYNRVKADVLKKLGHNIETKLLRINAPQGLS